MLTEISEKVSSLIKQAHANNVHVDRAANIIVERENERRTQLLVKALDTLVRLQDEYDKINKNNVKLVGENGPLEFMDEKRISEINKAKKKVSDLTAAFERAVSQEDYNGLEKALNSSNSNADAKKAESAEAKNKE